MKKIEAIIRTDKVKALTDSLREIGIGGLTLTEVKGFGRETTRPESYLILPKTKLEIYALDSSVDEIVEVITKTCRSGEMGDGKIVIYALDNVIRVRTGELKEEAIY